MLRKKLQHWLFWYSGEYTNLYICEDIAHTMCEKKDVYTSTVLRLQQRQEYLSSVPLDQLSDTVHLLESTLPTTSVGRYPPEYQTICPDEDSVSAMTTVIPGNKFYRHRSQASPLLAVCLTCCIPTPPPVPTIPPAAFVQHTQQKLPVSSRSLAGELAV